MDLARCRFVLVAITSTGVCCVYVTYDRKVNVAVSEGMNLLKSKHVIGSCLITTTPICRRSSGPHNGHNLCLLRFQRCCPFSMELTPFWHSRLFVIKFCRLLIIHSLGQAFSAPYRLTPMPQIRRLADTVHFEGFYSLTYLLTNVRS